MNIMLKYSKFDYQSISLLMRVLLTSTLLIISTTGTLFGLHFLTILTFSVIIIAFLLHIIYLKKHHIAIAALSIFMFLYLYLYDPSLFGSTKFLTKVLDILLFFTSVLILTQWIKIEEWITIFSKMPELLNGTLLSVSSTYAIGKVEVQKTSKEKKISGTNNWLLHNGKPYANSKFESFIDFIVFKEILSNGVYKQWKNWKERPSVKSDKSSSFLKLDDIYSIPKFANLYSSIFNSVKISPEWLKFIDIYSQNKDFVLEIGAGSGRLTEILKSKKLNYNSVESNPVFCSLWRERFTSSDHQFLISGSFPSCMPDKKYDLIILHQNVFLELINESSLELVCNDLRKYASSDCIILFDYICDLNISSNNKFVPLVQSNIENIGDVDYKYKYLGSFSNNVFDAQIKLNISKKPQFEEKYESVLKVYIPDVNTVIDCFQKYGFNFVEKIKLTNSFTFFPGQMNLFTIKHH